MEKKDAVKETPKVEVTKVEKKDSIEIPVGKYMSRARDNPWIVSTFILGIILILALVFNGGGGVTGNAVASEDTIGQDLIKFVEKQTGETPEIVSVETEGPFYVVTLTLQGQNVPVYLTKDGQYLIPGEPIGLNDNIPGLADGGSVAANTVPPTADDDPYLGPEDAEIVVIEFSDFECPYCGAAMGTYPALVQQFKAQDPSWTASIPELKRLAEEGKIKFVFRDFPLSGHPHAQKAAEAAGCAFEQGMFWEYHDKLFENQDALTIDDLKQYAKDLKLNTKAFDTCLDSGARAEEVAKDVADGTAAGVSGTPSFYVNDKEISGAVPFSAFEPLLGL